MKRRPCRGCGSRARHKLDCPVKAEREGVEALLDRFRTPGPCEWCGAWCRRREPAHVVSRGAGGPDMEENLVALGATWPFPLCPCHGRHHGGGVPTRLDLIDTVAKRMRLLPHEVLERIWKRRREVTRGRDG